MKHMRLSYLRQQRDFWRGQEKAALKRVVDATTRVEVYRWTGKLHRARSKAREYEAEIVRRRGLAYAGSSNV